MDRRKKATITCAHTMLYPLELGRDDEHSIGEYKNLCYRSRKISMQADKPIWFRHTRYYLVSGVVRVNAMTLLNFTELRVESEGGGGR